MDKILYEKFDASQVTDEMLQAASRLFSDHYGVWDESAVKVLGSFAKAGSQVQLGKKRLRADYLPDGCTSTYIMVTVDGTLAGNAFACRWAYGNKTVCWVTQLVVHRDYREKGLALGLLRHSRHFDDDIYGIMSSHPAACLAAAKAFGSSINTVQLDFIKHHAEEIMKASPMRYVKEAKLAGALFNPDDADGLMSSVDTDFWVDHTWPLEVLEWVREMVGWPLGNLRDGHEFLLLLEVIRRSGSRSGSGTQGASKT